MRDFLARLRRVIFWRLAFLEDELERTRTELTAELDRTRAELAKWQNALLIEKGLPPVHTPSPKPFPHLKGARVLPSQYRTVLERATRHAAAEAPPAQEKPQ